MSKEIIKKEITWGGRNLSLEVGRFAKQADSAVLGRYGDSLVLATVTTAPPKEDVDFFPLTVDYEERLYAAGRISTSRFIKREGRPSEEAILNGRLIDRSIRPLFSKEYQKEVQIIVTVLSYDQNSDPDVLSIITTSAALSISKIPWDGSVVAARVGFEGKDFVLNPGNEDSDFSLVTSFKEDKVVMIEGNFQEISEDKILASVDFAQEQSKPVFELIANLVKEISPEKESSEPKKIEASLKKEIVEFIKTNFKEKLFNPKASSQEGSGEDFKEEMHSKFEGKLSKAEMSKIFDSVVKEMVREKIIEEKKRPDGRDLDEIRDLEIEVGVLPRAHGSAVFSRGDTQVLTAATLGSTSLEQLIEGMSGEETKRFMHHYRFPPFSTGEIRRLGFPSRREIGHGALAERSLMSAIPAQEKFPYTIRLVSEVLSSSGSTSMAATCGSTLALMDAGVPISNPVSGIAMGLVTEGDKWIVLTDIQALEDFYGDMDFKIAGTKNGVTAIQLDVKIPGLNKEIINETLKKARVGIDFILAEMLKVIPESRSELSEYAPRITVIQIPPKKIGEVIGTGGKTINRIIEETGVAIDIEDDGKVMIAGNDPAGAEKAVAIIKGLTTEVKVGDTYEGEIKRIVNFGAFVEILPGKEGLVHISKLAPYHIEDINKEVKLGQKIKVKVSEIDDRGRINLTVS